MRIRPLTPGLDWDQYLDLAMRSFGPVDEPRMRANIEPIVAAGQALGAFDGDRLAGSALYLDMRQWWYGRAVPMAGVAGVQIAPEDRAQGVGRALMTALVDYMAERGYPLSALYPATMTIYRSLGWEIAGHRHVAVLPARSLRTLARPDGKSPDDTDRAGIRRPGPDDAAEVLEVIGRAHENARDCGPVSYDEATVRRSLTRPGRYADKDRYAYLAPDGFLGYHWQHGHDEIVIDQLAAASAQTTRALWGLAASHSSVAETARAAWPRCTRAPRSPRCAGPAWPTAAARPRTPPWTPRSPRPPSCSTPFRRTRRRRCARHRSRAGKFDTNRCSRI